VGDVIIIIIIIVVVVVVVFGITTAGAATVVATDAGQTTGLNRLDGARDNPNYNTTLLSLGPTVVVVVEFGTAASARLTERDGSVGRAPGAVGRRKSGEMGRREYLS
jgi:hypothetical protein